jgi:hypothetical protein
MKTMTEYLAVTDGMSPTQIKRWYSHLSSEDRLQLEIALAHITDEHYPHPAIGASGISELPDLSFYDGRFERFLCLKSGLLKHRVAGRND